MPEQRFGGSWTNEKLERIRKYLEAYMIIFTRNESARRYTTIYLDAFAGSGYSNPAEVDELDMDADLFSDLVSPETIALKDGSPRVALGLANPFDQYVFIEKNQRRADLLRATIQHDYSTRNASIHTEDANPFLQEWCRRVDWSKHRSVVFLDPYGMQVT